MQHQPFGSPLVAGFNASTHVWADLDLYAQQCRCAARVDAQRAALHTALARVVVFDCRLSWNGLGNSMSRWLNLLRVGLASRRAVFLWLADSDPPHDAWGETMRGRGFSETADLGEFFLSAAGVDWRWSRRTARRVAKVMRARGVQAPRFVHYFCRLHTHACEEPGLVWGGAVQRFNMASSRRAELHGATAADEALFVTHAQEQAGALVSWLRDSTAPWLIVRLQGNSTVAGYGEQTAFESSASFAARAIAAEGLCEVGGEQMSAQCEAHSLLRPRPWFQRRLVPVLR